MLFIPHKHLYISGTSYISADEPDYKEVITDANSRRRMGRHLKMAVWCGLKSLDGVSSERVAGIITSTGAGFMKDTISFGSSIFDREETLLNPSPFMQSTFNTASGYIALIRKIHAYNTTYVQQADGFAASVIDAAMLLDDAGEGDVALLGAFDEVTPEVDVIRQRLGLYRVGDGFLPLGEGAAAFLLSAANPTEVSESCRAAESSIGLGGDAGSESDSGQSGDDCSESVSGRGGESGSESSSLPLHESESASWPCDESGSKSDSLKGGDDCSKSSSVPLNESESASRPCDESGIESSSEPLHESGGTSSRSLSGTKDGNTALRFCGLANLSDLPKCADNPFAELFGINAGVNVISCADHVESLGAFRSLLPVLFCKLISEQQIPDGYTAIMDDVNEDGVIVLLHK